MLRGGGGGRGGGGKELTGATAQIIIVEQGKIDLDPCPVHDRSLRCLGMHLVKPFFMLRPS